MTQGGLRGLCLRLFVLLFALANLPVATMPEQQGWCCKALLLTFLTASFCTCSVLEPRSCSPSTTTLDVLRPEEKAVNVYGRLSQSEGPSDCRSLGGGGSSVLFPINKDVLARCLIGIKYNSNWMTGEMGLDPCVLSGFLFANPIRT